MFLNIILLLLLLEWVYDIFQTSSGVPLYPITDITCPCDSLSTESGTQNCFSYSCEWLGSMSFTDCVDYGDEKNLCLDNIVYSKDQNYKERKGLFFFGYWHNLYHSMDFKKKRCV